MAKTTTGAEVEAAANESAERRAEDDGADTAKGEATTTSTTKRTATKDDQLPTSGAVHTFEASTATWVASDTKQAKDHRETTNEMAKGMDFVTKDEF